MAVSTNTWLPHTTGELQLRPGISIFHATLSVALHVSGRRGSSAATPALVPRNCGQCCASADVARRRVKRAVARFAVPVMRGNIHRLVRVSKRSGSEAAEQAEHAEI